MKYCFTGECESELADLHPDDISQPYICFVGDTCVFEKEEDGKVFFHFELDYIPETGEAGQGASRTMVMPKYIFEANTLTKREYDRRFLEGLFDGG
jgi:hypothetical protein